MNSTFLNVAHVFQVMQLGDPFVFLEGYSLPDGKLSVSFTCPSVCTEVFFEVRV